MSGELFGFALVVIAGIVAFRLLLPNVSLSFGDLSQVPAYLGFVDASRPLTPLAKEPSTQGVETAGAVAAGPAAAPTATCPGGAQPAFVLGMAELKAKVGDPMGSPLECEHPSTSGDTVQRTTTGLAYYDKKANVPAFTNGWAHWALVGGQVVYWEGESADPPPPAPPTPARPNP